MAIIFMHSTASGADPASFQVLRSDSVTIEYERGLKSAALEILGEIPSIEEQIKNRTGLKRTFPFDVVVYKDRDDFVKRSGNDLIAAFAIPAESTIVLDLSRMRLHPLNIKLITMHELTHLILHYHIRKEHIPKWFDEGVSEWVSGISEIFSYEKTDVLKRAAISNRLIPLYRLNRSFPASREEFSLAYEQSRNIIEFMEKRYGEHAIRVILSRLSNGEGFHDAIRHEFSVVFSEMEEEWKRSLRTQYTWLGYISSNIYWILFVTAAFVTIIGFLRLRKRIKDYPEDEDKSDQFP